MKFITLLLILFSFSLQAGLPPTTLNGTTTFNFKAQNVTRVGTAGLIEDEKNYLLNPNMEGGNSSGTATSWDKSNSTGTAATYTISTSTSEVMEGLQAQKIVFNSTDGDLDYRQMVTVASGMPKQWIVGIGYSASSTVAGFQICSMVDNAEKDCVPTASLILDGLPHVIEIPTVITGTTNIGIKVKSTNSTGTVILDKAYIKQGLGTQALQLDSVYSANVSSTGTVTLENKDWISGSCVMSGTNSATGTCTFNAGIFTVAPTCTTSSLEAAGSVRVVNIRTTPTTVVWDASTPTPTYAATGVQIICQKSGNDYLAASSAVYSQASANTSSTSYTPTVGAGFGTVTSNVAHWYREGENLVVRGTFVTGTVTTAVGSISLPNGYTIDSTKLSIPANTTSAVGTKIGTWAVDTTSQLGQILTAPGTSTSLVYFSFGQGGTSPLIPTTSISTSAITSNSDPVAYEFRVPISGWSNAATIVGSFAGVPSVPAYSGAVDTFTVSFANANAGTASATNCTATPCNIDQIGSAVLSSNGVTWQSLGHYTFNTIATYSNLKCSIQAINMSTGLQVEGQGQYSCKNCAGFAFLLNKYDGSVFYDAAGNITCIGAR